MTTFAVPRGVGSREQIDSPATPPPTTPSTPPSTGQARIPAWSGPTGVPAAALPPAGPAWLPVVMGTGILATLLQVLLPGSTSAHAAAVTLLGLGWVILLGLTGTFVHRVSRDRSALADTMSTPAVQPLWGTVSMGLLAIGSATLTIGPTLSPAAAQWSVALDTALWTLGTALGVVTALGFAAVIATRDAGSPTPVWGLAMVSPMVSATTGAALVPHVATPAGRFLLLVAAAGCFALALALGVLVFAIAYLHLWRKAPLAIAASPSAWIPLGIVGQSTAAAQAIARQADQFLQPSAVAIAHDVADLYGYAMLAVGAPLAAYAAYVTVRGFVGRMPFTPGWWALTFPIGTLCLGMHLLGQASGHRAFEVGSGVALVVLVGTWTLCATATVRAVTRLGAGRPGC